MSEEHSEQLEQCKGAGMMSPIHNRMALDFWLGQSNVDMNNNSLWGQLTHKLRSCNLNINVTLVKDHWVAIIDPWIEKAFGKKITSREELGYSVNLPMDKKMEIMSARVKLLKSALASTTSKSDSYNMASTHGDLDSNYVIKMETALPFKFRRNKEGSASVDTHTALRLPVQIFAGCSFFLIGAKSSYIPDIAMVHSLEWIIKMYGGRVVFDYDELTDDTIILCSFDRNTNLEFRKCFLNVIYRLNMIFDLTRLMRRPTPSYMKQYALHFSEWEVLNSDSKDACVNEADSVVVSATKNGSRKRKSEALDNEKRDSRSGCPTSKKKKESREESETSLRQLLALFFQLSHSHGDKASLVEATKAEYNRLYAKNVSYKCVMKILETTTYVSYTYALLKDEFKLADRDKLRLMNLLGYDVKPLKENLL